MSTHSVSSGTNVFLPAQIRRSLWTRMIGAVREWRRRAYSRRELAVLSDLELKDLGYPADVEGEKYKPFWRI